MILETIIVPLILVGLVFFFGCVVGMVRFPDFYTRMHAAGKGDTLSTMLILAGFALYAIHSEVSLSTLLVAAKILGICFFIMLTSPTSTHALMRAGYEDGVIPYDGPGQDRKENT
jgi:multicomponent Na+:H+ antiporter subunit G